MPRYFFDIDDGAYLRDGDGTTLTDLSEIEPITLRTLADIARDKSLHTREHPITVTVRDEAGCSIFRAALVMQAVWIDETARSRSHLEN